MFQFNLFGDMGVVDWIRAHHAKHLRRMTEDPYHYPMGANLVPLTVVAFVLYTIIGAFRIAATTGRAYNPFVLLGIELMAIVLAAGLFAMATRVYELRRDFARRHPKLYRGTQVWRGLLGVFALGAVWVTVTSPEITMPTTAAGALPLWLFALIIFGSLSFISLSTSALAHIAFVLFQRANGRIKGGGGSLYDT